MSMLARDRSGRGPLVQTYLLGRVDFDTCLALQQRLVFEARDNDDGRFSLLICEHPDIITVGRRGSRAHIRLSERELSSRRLEIRWVGRGGGCIAPAPGQLAVYPIGSLAWHGWTVGEYMERFERGLLATLKELGIGGQTRSGRFGIWGRTGQLVAMGVAVKNWISYHGAFINVNPAMSTFGYVDTNPPEAAFPDDRPTMGCLQGENGRVIRMTKVRAAVTANLASLLGGGRYHLYTGHPLLTRAVPPHREVARRAS